MNKGICIAALIAITIASACGGGGGGGGGGGQQPTGAVMHVMASAGSTTAYGSSGISGVGVTVTFPFEVAVKTDTTGIVDSSVVVPSGAVAGTASVAAIYTAATTTVNGKLDLIVASTTQNGFGTGEFVTINFIISSGSPTAGSFTITNFEPYNLLSQRISGMESGFTVSIQ